MRPLALPDPLRTRRAARAAGYTAVEVLMAMTVMVIGAAAVMSMQKASIQGNLDARKTDVANNIARTWMERLQRVAMQWTCPSPACTASNLGLSTLIGAGSNTGGNVTGQWFLPPNAGKTPETLSPGFDILGRDLPTAQLPPSAASGWPGATFCVNVRLTWLVKPAVSEPGLIRADVRVLWPRGILGGAPATGFCDTATAALADPETVAPANERPFFHTIYLTSNLKENPAQ